MAYVSILRRTATPLLGVISTHRIRTSPHLKNYFPIQKIHINPFSTPKRANPDIDMKIASVVPPSMTKNGGLKPPLHGHLIFLPVYIQDRPGFQRHVKTVLQTPPFFNGRHYFHHYRNFLFIPFSS
jgi:hypothetical protein